MIVANTRKEIHSWNRGLLVLGTTSPVSRLIPFMLLSLLLRLYDVSNMRFAHYVKQEAKDCLMECHLRFFVEARSGV